ncbi:hypothetical protein F5Y07DRAFT_367972 [Xylaria sp. FL0933]|nr:hypothetical protein F5Y07DRAFT_367972 [Xylaria sp. FL0933]
MSTDRRNCCLLIYLFSHYGYYNVFSISMRPMSYRERISTAMIDLSPGVFLFHLLVPFPVPVGSAMPWISRACA